MLLTLNVLNDDATLNSWEAQDPAAEVMRGSDANLVLQLWQVDRKIRFIPGVSAVITAQFLNSDQTTLSKTATFPFADDRSIIKIALAAAETPNLISQNLIVTIVDSGVTRIARLQMGLQMISPSQEGC